MLSATERRILRAVAEAVVPPGRFFAAGGEATVRRLELFLAESRAIAAGYRLALWMLELGALLSAPHRRFSRLGIEERERLLRRWRQGSLLRWAVADVLCDTVKVAHFSDPETYARLGCVFDKRPRASEPERWMEQVRTGSDIAAEETIACDVAVVGTGAGGAVVAKELAERGHAVLMLEEGKYHTRSDFAGQAADSTKRFYRDSGLTAAIGNTMIFTPMGRLVGGSTAINTGTCWRTPAWILDRWVRELGLAELSEERLRPYFERVESAIRVEQAKPSVVGGIANVVGRGCDALGLRHFPVRRNAPDCDGQGVCTFGCPTDARRSTNVSYVPLALRSNAVLVTETRARRVLLKDGRAVGLEAESVADGRRFRIEARAVVLACGAIPTPALLLAQGIGNASGQVGKNLTLHPATTVCAMLDDDEIASYRHVPQGYCVDSLHRMGILFLGAGLPLDMGAAAVGLVGGKFSEIMSRFDHLASFGVMVEDRPSGRVVVLGGKPRVFYWLRKRERSLLKLGVETMAEVFLAAGAREVYPLVRGFDVIASAKDLEAFRNRSFPASSFRIASFHPLGTCRMGKDPRTSVVDTNHETHDVRSLYICDGSVVPTSIAVNSQETIMALAARAADRIHEALS